jgi:hypothetical protein
VPGLPSVFRRLLKEGASAHLPDGWTLRGAGLVLHASDGCWGQIVFSGASREEVEPRSWDAPDDEDFVAEWPILRMSLTAGTCAPCLIRTVNKLDPSKPPTPNFVAAHTRVCWYVPFVLAQAARPTPQPFEIPTTASTGDRYYIDVDTATTWLTRALAKLAPATQALSSNRAIYEWLSAQHGSFSLRYAYLLARHVGLDSDLAALGERARKASEEERRRSQVRDGTSADRQTTYPQDWSHERFMRFVESTPP